MKESSTCYKSTPLKVSEANFNVWGHAATDEVSSSLKWHYQPGKKKNKGLLESLKKVCM